MTERFVRVSVKDSVREAVKETVELVGAERTPKKGLFGRSKKDDYKGVVEAVLRGVATKIVLTHSLKDLGSTLAETVTLVRAGGLDAGKIDLLRGRVLDSVKKIKDGKEGREISEKLNEHFRQGKYEEAARWLQTIVDAPEIGIQSADKTALTTVLGKVKKESSTTPTDLQDLAVKRDELKQNNDDSKKELFERSDEIQMEVGKAEVVALIKNEEPPEVEKKRSTGTKRRREITREMAGASNFEDRDKKFVENVLIGKKGSKDWTLDFETMDRKAVYHIWYRTSGILGRSDWSLEPETQKMLQEMNASARGILLENATENLVIDAMTPAEAAYLALPIDERNLIEKNLNFIGDTRGDFRELLKRSESYGQEDVESPFGRMSRTDASMLELIREYENKNPNFRLSEKLVKNESSGKWEWVGLAGQSKQKMREELLDVCRGEVYGIQGQLTQENMGNLIFEESAQKYLALMRIDVGDDLKLEEVKDVITKLLYIEFAVKTMWRAGGNIESWQRGANVLTQDNERNFFQLMEMGEMLKMHNESGEELEIGRFNWADLMTLAEMKASNGQYYITYLAGQSSDLRGERKPEFVAAMADMILKKRVLKGEMTAAEARAFMLNVQSGGFEFSDRQIRSMVDYMQFLEVATFRGGEFGLNDSIIPGKFNLTSLPCGEVVHKTGPWSIIYDWFYPVTKYGGEWVGKLFLPNVNLLSYRRGETLAHFMAKDSKVAAGLLDKAGNYHETGVGAKEFFYSGSHEDDAKAFAKFWAEVIFDPRTGGALNKTAINRTVDSIRREGLARFNSLDAAGQLGFVGNLNFHNFETMVGYTVPGATNKEKFKWITENFDYSFWRKDILPSKAVGDWVGKYVPKKYEEARLKLAAFLNAPGTATLGALRDIISEYSDESTFNEMAQAVLKDNRKGTFGRRMIDKNGHEQGTFGYDAASGKLKWVGYKHADRNKSNWVAAPGEEGEYWTVTEQWHSALEGFHLGSGIATSRQQGKELFRDPMYFEKLEIDNQFHAGMINSREEWGRMKREFQMKAYFGDVINIGGRDFRLGYIPVLTPFFLFRGWWVDRMQLDFEDFMIALRKNNKETWEKLKKVIGI